MTGWGISFWGDSGLVKAWRSVASVEDIAEGEIFLATEDGPPPMPVPAPLTPAELVAIESAKLSGLMAEANAQQNALTNRISTIQDAIDLDMVTPAEEAELPVRQGQLKAWKTYAVLLGRVTTQSGWWASVIWPVKPTSGMDLTVNGSAPEST